MIRNFLLLFLALRAADGLNLAGGLWLVPKFVAPADLGGILPLTTLATLVSFPLYAVAMTALRESARLRSEGAFGRLRTFVRGVFAAVGLSSVLVLAVTAALLPGSLERLHISDSLSGHLAVVAAFLGCVAPVYLDQLQAARRFGAVGVVEILAAVARLAAMWVLMPIRALAGYYAGGVVRLLTQIGGSLLVLRGVSAASAESYWTRENLFRLGRMFVMLVPYLAVPMLVSLTENDLVRTRLPYVDSAGYYMVTRISDLMNYLTYPLLFVMFPYVTDHSVRGESYVRIVKRSVLVLFAVAVPFAALAAFAGADLLALLPNGGNYAMYSDLLPLLIAFMAFGAAQSLVTNAEVAAGRFSFLWWLVPLEVAYVELLPRLMNSASLDTLCAVFALFALLRFLFSLAHLRK